MVFYFEGSPWYWPSMNCTFSKYTQTPDLCMNCKKIAMWIFKQAVIFWPMPLLVSLDWYKWMRSAPSLNNLQGKSRFSGGQDCFGGNYATAYSHLECKKKISFSFSHNNSDLTSFQRFFAREPFSKPRTITLVLVAEARNLSSLLGHF